MLYGEPSGVPASIAGEPIKGFHQFGLAVPGGIESQPEVFVSRGLPYSALFPAFVPGILAASPP